MAKYYLKINILVKIKGRSNVKKEDFANAFKSTLIDLYGTQNPAIVDEAVVNFVAMFSLTVDENIKLSIEKIKNCPYKNANLKLFLLNIIEDSRKLTFDNSSKYFDSKIVEAEKKFTGQDLEIAMISINTGKSSFSYWNGNFGNWYKLFNTETGRRGGRAVGVADIAGATVGAMYGAVGGNAFLPGVGTVAGALAVGCAGGLYASAVASVASCLNSWLGE